MHLWAFARIGGPALAAAVALTALVPSTAQAASEISAFDAVNQFIGTELDTTQNKSNDAYGNTFPGAGVPFGMVQPSPATWAEGNANVGQKGGYEFPTIPFTGELPDGTLPASPATNVKDYYLPFSHPTRALSPASTA